MVLLFVSDGRAEQAVTANRAVPRVTPPASRVVLSANPTTDELSRARIFSEPLVPSREPAAGENTALARAMAEYLATNNSEKVAPLTRFLATFPASAWRVSLLTNLGTVYAANGFYAAALNAWNLAWLDGAPDTDPRRKAVADLAVSEWLALSIRVGHIDEVAERLEQVADRPFHGRAAQQVASARERLWIVRYQPEHVHASGPAAIAAILGASARAASQPVTVPERLRAYRFTPAGTSLGELRTLARSVGLPWEMLERPRDAAIPVPSIMHWRVGHFTAIVQRDGDRYLLVDSILGGAKWVSRDMLDQEGSGYFLAPRTDTTATWARVAADVAATVIGRCDPNTADDSEPPCTNPCTCKAGGGGGSSGGGGCAPSPGMATYWIQPMTASLAVSDVPLTYVPPVGPAVPFRITYYQRQPFQPQLFTYSNAGAWWTFDWLSFVVDDATPAHAGWEATVVLRGGGAENYFMADPTGVYPAHWRTRAVLVRTSADPIRYERRLRDGSVEVFAQSNGSQTTQRQVFLTDIIDAKGLALHLTYDDQLRVVAITDAAGLVTTLSYDLASDPEKVTRMTDPFGRSATLTYAAEGLLASITDAIGLRSSFVYGDGDFITALTTPYGTTRFTHEADGDPYDTYFRFVQAIDPVGGTERAEFRWSTTDIASVAPAAEVPTGMTAYNHDLDKFNTFYWDKRAMATAPGAVGSATITHWLSSVWTDVSLITGTYAIQIFTSGVPHSVKRPLEHRAWYAYPGQEAPYDRVGAWVQPTQTARVLDDGSTQLWQATYNNQGNVTTRTDPVGRQTTYEYAANGIDLVAIRQTSNGINDALATFSNYTAQHVPQTTTDAAGQATTFTLNANGQPLTTTNAKSETTTLTYDGDGRLLTTTAALPDATTTYTYDAVGRVRTVTDSDGYTVTTDYDTFDRPTKVTYPDGTTETTTYDRLDVASRTDRLGRSTRYFYDPLRRLVATRDPLGRVVTQTWCPCGSLDALTDANGHATSWQRDVQGRITQETRADGTTTTHYTYDTTTSRLKTVTDPKQQVTTYTYNLDDTMQQVAYTNAQVPTPSVSYTYDASYNRVATMVDGTGTTAYAYHPSGELGAGQMASVDGPLDHDTITHDYDELGRVASRAIDGVALLQEYDPLGRTTSETNVLGTFTYAYDGVTRRLASVSYPNGQTSAYAYLNNAGDHRLQTIHHQYPTGATLSKFDYTYDAVGNILTSRQQADTTTVDWTYGYDGADQLTSAATHADPDGALVQRFSYVYDPAGNRLSEQIDDAVTTSSYDVLNRIVEQHGGGSVVVKGQVNEPSTVMINGQPATVRSDGTFQGTAMLAAGTTTVNVIATDTAGNSTAAAYEIDQTAANKTFTFDANGNLTSDGSRTFEWDARNQLVAVTIGTHRSEFTYDGQKRRVRVVEKENSVIQADTKVIWCRTMICEERAADGVTVTRRSFSQGEQAAGTIRLFVGDRLGSLDAATDMSGTLLARYTFDPWGRRTVPTGTDITNIGYAGQRWESPSNLSLTLYRTYDPEVGRWLSEDPAGRVDGPNLYTYAVNEPTRRIDPLGDTSQCCSCSVQVKCRPVGGLIGIFADHCYIVAKDAQCKTWYIESGPNGNQNFAGEGNSPKGLDATSSTTWTGDTGTSDCKVVECLRRSIANWNSANVAYDPMGPNSNSFVSWILTECGMHFAPPPTGRTPGWY
jgi:RHS repeat-associated protein